MASEALIKVIEEQDALDQASDKIQPLVTGAFKSAGPAGQEVKNFLHGTWLGHPLHPVLTDVPIGAWTAALALDAMESISGREGLGAGAARCAHWPTPVHTSAALSPRASLRAT